eukprot:CAMPEP_0170295060 /NCGR_PEP_ID=MMETSP0116_2-20130129/47651_1 /TAXON_ID=400756 /ORGANISM="Durinskia baltica, Strain CSIRO CS-38" /LENGTH=66 /DNA_ID=CAMNT_0010546605 /DNA_START=122 /DNA_END=322 /DNA_ORIENTATION=-
MQGDALEEHGVAGAVNQSPKEPEDHEGDHRVRGPQGPSHAHEPRGAGDFRSLLGGFGLERSERREA